MSCHKAEVVKGSVQRTPVGGIAMVLRCCSGTDKLERTIHHQAPGKLTTEERKQWIERALADLENEHDCVDCSVDEFKQFEAAEPEAPAPEEGEHHH